MKRKLFLATAFAAVAATAGAGIVFAAGAADWPSSRGGATAKAIGGGTGSGCGRIWETREDPFPPNFIGDPEVNQTPASSVTFVKKCNGSTMVTFSSETAAPQIIIESQPGTQDVDNDDIAIYVRATCVAGLPHVPGHCTTGEVQYALPGGGGPGDVTFFDLAPDIHEVHSMQWAFGNLGAGHWRIDVVPVGLVDDPNSWLEFRTLFVESL
jgi:hypothetical protein